MTLILNFLLTNNIRLITPKIKFYTRQFTTIVTQNKKLKIYYHGHRNFVTKICTNFVIVICQVNKTKKKKNENTILQAQQKAPRNIFIKILDNTPKGITSLKYLKMNKARPA